ncbi:MAG: winged helix-turn-helix domain-containing protein [Clostridia bacterium]|nr:winged helix-turn-helix domain-containing protein [Clostridia bacterium]
MISIELFGKFVVKVDGKDATRVLGNSKKGRRMLEYLILHRDELMASSELYELLWPDEEIANPESALKTLVSRTRSALSRFDPLLSDCIITSRGAYRWNTELPHTVDVFMFEALCMELLQVSAHDPAMEEKLERALALYKGDLSAMTDSESWIISRNAYYSALCIKTSQHAIRLMEEKQHGAGVARVARRGLEVDPLDEEMNLALMRALVKLNRHNEALSHYHRAKDVHFNEYGLRLPESIQSFYRRIIQSDQTLDTDIDSIRQSLEQANAGQKGAFSCEYAVFMDACLPLARNLARLGESCCLVMMMISPAGGRTGNNAAGMEKAMGSLLWAMGKVLRPQDIMTRYSATQVLMLLPSETMDTCQALIGKIRQVFAKVSQDAVVKLTSRFECLTGGNVFHTKFGS